MTRRVALLTPFGLACLIVQNVAICVNTISLFERSLLLWIGSVLAASLAGALFGISSLDEPGGIVMGRNRFWRVIHDDRHEATTSEQIGEDGT